MSAGEEIKKLKDTVYGLLKENPVYRDSDKKLCCRIWAEQLHGVEMTKKITAYQFLCTYSSDESYLFSQDSITRARRKWQEEDATLRGKNWVERQNEQGNVKNNLNNW